MTPEIEQALAWADDPGEDVLINKYARTLARAVRQQEKELAENDTVPRSRYDVACDQYNEAERLRKEQFVKAREAYRRAEQAEARWEKMREYINGMIVSDICTIDRQNIHKEIKTSVLGYMKALDKFLAPAQAGEP